MQVFMPYVDPKTSASVLDTKRLGKQRVEIKYMLEVMYGMWPYRKHPIIEMWWDYPKYLEQIYYYCVQEWASRGFKNTMPDKIRYALSDPCTKYEPPPWLRDYTPQYQGLLLYKDFEFYKDKFPGVEPIDKIPYLTRDQIKEIYG